MWYYNSKSGEIIDMKSNDPRRLNPGWYALKLDPDDTPDDPNWIQKLTKAIATLPIFGNPALPHLPTNQIPSPGEVVEATKNQFLPDLDLWLKRIAEVVIGGLLIGVGIAKLTGTDNAIAKLVKAGVTKGVVK